MSSRNTIYHLRAHDIIKHVSLALNALEYDILVFYNARLPVSVSQSGARISVASDTRGDILVLLL